ncbi:MAG: nuclear transport factor 2 family protein [Bacteroidota bacterium]
MTPDEFIKAYEKALGSQNWANVDPLVHDNANVIFSNGKVNKGKSAVQAAFEHNFTAIKNETFVIENVNWLHKSSVIAVYTFEYKWEGIFNGQKIGGQGVGTSVLKLEEGHWQLLSEHLGKT